MTNHTGLQIDPTLDIPLYEQIVTQIARKIDDGVYPAGFRLPPTRELAAELGTHRNTVVRAFEELVTTGYVTSVVGRGTFVAERSNSSSQDGPISGGLQWSSLVSRVAGEGPQRRLDRLRRAPVSPGTINLTRMQPSADLLPDELFRRCVDHTLRTRGTAALGYAPREGEWRLRESIAEELQRRGVPAQTDDVLITSGSQQGLDVVLRCLVDPGDPFLVERETYSGALSLLSAARAHVVPVACDEEGPDIEALHRLGRSGLKGFYVIPNAQNPTGRTMAGDRREALVQWSREFGVPLIEDDYAAELDLATTPRPPALRALDRDVIHIGTFSKNLIPAVRIGYLVCPPELRDTVVSMKHTMDLGTSALLQHAVAEFLERGYFRAHLKRTLPEYRRRRDALLEELRRALPDDVTIHAPNRGVSIWIELPTHLDPERVYDAARREGVLVAPGTLNGTSRDQRGVRVTYCSEAPDELREGARRLGRALEKLDASRRGGEDSPNLDLV